MAKPTLTLVPDCGRKLMNESPLPRRIKVRPKLRTRNSGDLLQRNCQLRGDHLAPVEPRPDMPLSEFPPGVLRQFSGEGGLTLGVIDGLLDRGSRLHEPESYNLGCETSTTKSVGRSTTALVGSAAVTALSKLVKDRRQALGWSQAELGKRAGVSQQMIGKLEKGKAVETRKLTGIAGAFGLTVDEFLGDCDPTPPKEKKVKIPDQWPFPFSPDLWKTASRSKKRAIIRMAVAVLQDETVPAKISKKTRKIPVQVVARQG